MAAVTEIASIEKVYIINAVFNEIQMGHHRDLKKLLNTRERNNYQTKFCHTKKVKMLT